MHKHPQFFWKKVLIGTLNIYVTTNLTFKKGEIIAVVPKHDAYTEKVMIPFILKGVIF